MKIPSASSTMSPCKGCDIRAAGCHAICMRYAAYREELEDKRQHRKQELMRDGMTLPGVKNELRRRDKERMQRRTQGRR